jgi:hypothetical protein
LNQENLGNRVQQTLEKTTAWLRKAGVEDNEPLHFFRKLSGSLICDKHSSRLEPSNTPPLGSSKA